LGVPNSIQHCAVSHRVRLLKARLGRVEYLSKESVDLKMTQYSGQLGTWFESKRWVQPASES
jgi:hypothetical protein